MNIYTHLTALTEGGEVCLRFFRFLSIFIDNQDFIIYAYYFIAKPPNYIIYREKITVKNIFLQIPKSKNPVR